MQSGTKWYQLDFGQPFTKTVIQVYAPTTDAEEEKADMLYSYIQSETERSLKQDMLCEIRDWNAKAGNCKKEKSVELYALGNRD